MISGLPFGVEGLLYILVSYLIGAIPFAYLIARQLKGIDIREHGSKNAGATNVMRVVGKKAGITTLLLDFCKGMLPVIIGQQLFPTEYWLHFASAMAAVIGHSKSVFLGFTGGKSAATGLGAVFGLNLLGGLGVAVVAASVMFLSRYVSLGSMLASLAAPFIFYALGAPIAYIAFTVIAGLYVVIKHKANIQRLLSGTENRIGAPKPVNGSPSNGGSHS